MTRFEPFSRVTRSSLGKLKAAVWTPWLASPAQKISFDHHHRGKSAELRVAIFRVDREMVLDVLELAGKFLQLRAFRFVLDSDEGLESRLCN